MMFLSQLLKKLYLRFLSDFTTEQKIELKTNLFTTHKSDKIYFIIILNRLTSNFNSNKYNC